MVVCQCLRVSDAQIRASVLAGAATVDEVTARCDAGGGCGRCWSTIEAMVAAAGPGAARAERTTAAA